MTNARATRVLDEVDRARDDLVALARELISFATVNPPGDGYRSCAEHIGRRLESTGATVELIEAPWDDPACPRVNVIGRWQGSAARPCVHLNGHFDVVPAGDGWSVDPFAGTVRDGRLIGRGSSDMKGGIASAVVAVEALLRAGIPLAGSIELSGTVDEESGGLAGVAHLCEIGRITSDNTDYAIIPEPFGPDRICVGHKGVYWCDITAHGRIAHGSMPHLGQSAIDDMTALLEALRTELGPELSSRVTSMSVVPEPSRASSMNVNAIVGGQPVDGGQTPCVADRCTATIDRRFIPEETLEGVREEILAIVREVEAAEPGRRYEVVDRLSVRPVRAPDGSPLVTALGSAIAVVRGREAELVGSPGTYDQKHFAGIAGVEHCVAYGPGPLQEAHQPDESCSIDDMVDAAKVMALALLELVGERGG